MTHFIFITGGVVSSLGKGLASASLGALLQARGYKVRLRKLDPYLNVDPGTMSPEQHGEVFVTDDGTEADLDLGHYERLTGLPAGRFDSTTTGRIYTDLLARERRGDFLGRTVQVVPHVTDAIKAFIRAETEDYDFVLLEIGGTVGDIEALPFLEAARQFQNEVPRHQAIFVHAVLLPYVGAAGELKTKPAQHSVRELRGIGIQPDILLCRTDRAISADERQKLGLFCNVRESAIIEALDARSIYDVPLAYHAQGLDTEVLAACAINNPAAPNLGRWQDISDRLNHPEGRVTIAVVGKYAHQDAYKSVSEALCHGGLDNRVTVDVDWVESEQLEREDIAMRLAGAHGILVPGGFGHRGFEGKIGAIHYARTNDVPVFGVCLGMQAMCLEFARNEAEIEGAGSTEFGPAAEPVVALMTEWVRDGAREQRLADDAKGGTMRLGSYETRLRRGSRAFLAYGEEIISERHRHRYEVNVAYKARLEQRGLRFTGMSPDGLLPEIVELEDHPWFIGVQFHPELRSRPFAPHPLFSSFIGAAIQQSRLI